MSEMNMSGKVIAVLPAKGGVSQRTGKMWETHTFVIETQDQYPKKAVIEVFDADGGTKWRDADIAVGDIVTASINIDASEYNGRWYNQVRAWRIVKGDFSS